MNLNKLSDEELMWHFQQGKETAYNILVERYQGKLLTHIFYYVKDRERAEDIVQDAFVRLYLHRDKYKDIAKVSTWIYTIATNLAKTDITKHSRVDKFSITGKEGENDFEINDHHASTDGSLLKNELRDILMKAIEQLEEKFREVIVMRDIENLSYDEIAEILEVPVGTVKSRINRARLNLRELVQDYIKI